jgi:hypothetical protein
MRNCEGKSHSGDLGVTSDVKMDIRGRVVVIWFEIVAPRTGASGRLLRAWYCSYSCVALYVESASDVPNLQLSPERFVLWASLWGIPRCVAMDRLPHSQALRCHSGRFCNCPYCPADACESQLIIGPQIAGWVTVVFTSSFQLSVRSVIDDFLRLWWKAWNRIGFSGWCTIITVI